MTPPESVPSPTHLERATQALADSGRARALEVSADVLAQVMSQPRRSMPLTARAPHSQVHVSEQVIVTVLSRAIAQHTHGLAVARATVTPTPDGRLDRVLVELIGQYGTDLVVATSRAREVVASVLRDLIGPTDESVEVTTAPTHLHIGTVTVGDPELSDPRHE